VTVSIGVSCIKEGDKSSKDLFERADMAVYKAKENGRNQVMTQ
ncbi:MAG: diguanylate cyclase, partial [Desulfobacter sp.]|nr:diguanylate cyclase [Desulfobacter sp.]